MCGAVVGIDVYVSEEYGYFEGQGGGGGCCLDLLFCGCTDRVLYAPPRHASM